MPDREFVETSSIFLAITQHEIIDEEPTLAADWIALMGVGHHRPLRLVGWGLAGGSDNLCAEFSEVGASALRAEMGSLASAIPRPMGVLGDAGRDLVSISTAPPSSASASGDEE